VEAIPDWRAWLHEPFEGEEEYYTSVRQQTLTGRLRGGPGVVQRLEKRIGRTLRPNRRSPKPGTKYRTHKVS